jgi:hypothetical protein
VLFDAHAATRHAMKFAAATSTLPPLIRSGVNAMRESSSRGSGNSFPADAAVIYYVGLLGEAFDFWRSCGIYSH